MRRSNTEITNAQRRYLRGLAHDINPVVMVSDKGLSETVLAAIDEALDQHELIKVKLRSDRETRKAWADTIETQFQATAVQKIGQVACFYRPNPKKPVIELPKR